MVSNIIYNIAYKSDLQYTIRKYIVFHVSLLDRYTHGTASQQPAEPQPKIVHDSDEWDIDQVLNSKRLYRKLHYLVQYAGFSYRETSWEPLENLRNVEEFVEKFHRKQPRKPRR